MVRVWINNWKMMLSVGLLFGVLSLMVLDVVVVLLFFFGGSWVLLMLVDEIGVQYEIVKVIVCVGGVVIIECVQEGIINGNWLVGVVIYVVVIVGDFMMFQVCIQVLEFGVFGGMFVDEIGVMLVDDVGNNLIMENI